MHHIQVSVARMIDIGLTKIALIGVVALVVIGPEKLPRVARMVGTLLGRAQRYISQVKSEVGREIELDELRKMQKEMRDAASEVEQTITKDFSQTEQEVSSGWDEHDPTLSDSWSGATAVRQRAVKAKDFRRKKMAHSSAIPSWYKRQHGRKTRVISGAARVARYRPAAAKKPSASFH